MQGGRVSCAMQHSPKVQPDRWDVGNARDFADRARAPAFGLCTIGRVWTITVQRLENGTNCNPQPFAVALLHEIAVVDPALYK
eukprot:scaffold142038_cov41-Prasinocladus_malaysianus.AAC.2